LSRLFEARVDANIRIAESVKLITLDPLDSIERPCPGQFFMLGAGCGNDPLLKRPFSIFRGWNGKLQFLYRIRGKGTLCIANCKKDDIINIMGPLGNSWPEPAGDFIVLAGGIGVASVYSLIEAYPQRAGVFCGYRNCEELLMLEDIGKLAKKVSATTDDGSYCRAGLITEPFTEFIGSAQFSDNPLPVYACGPTPMLKALAAIIKGKNLKCHVSLEEVMACGVGACLGCVCKTKSGYTRICKEGPVFDIEDIVWE
jgi:dihydroorotate dehydrogenase electron transfer subunit